MVDNNEQTEGNYIGTCPCCNDKVHELNLWVEEDGEIYHFYCYNKLKGEKK